MKLLRRLRWMLTRCGYCKRRLWFSGFILIGTNPRKSWARHAIHDRECRPVGFFIVNMQPARLRLKSGGGR